MRLDPLSEAVTERRRDRVLALAVVVEAATGLALLIAPALVARLLLGVEGNGIAAVFERLFGISLLALGLACWSANGSRTNAFAAVRAMLAYNLLIALYLGYVGAVEHLDGWLLWPAIVFHIVMTILLFWTRPATATANGSRTT